MALSVLSLGIGPALEPGLSRSAEVARASDNEADQSSTGWWSRLTNDPLDTMTPASRFDLAGADCSGENVGTTLTLLEAATKAVCRNPQARAAFAAVKERSAAQGVARSAWLPTIAATGATNYSRLQSTSGPNAPSTETFRGQNGSVALNQVLYDSGARAAASEKARADLVAALAGQSVVTQQLLFTAVQAYVIAQAKLAAVEAWADAVLSAEETFRAAQAKRAHGEGNAAEVLQAKSALSRVQLERSRARTQAEGAIVDLNAAIGIDPDSPTQLPAFNERTPKPATPIALGALMDDLEARHPALIAGNAQVESIRAQIDGVKAAGLPSLAFNTSYFLNGRPGNVQGNVHSNEHYLGLTLTIPLFEGFGPGYKVAQAEAQLEGELAKLELTTANVRSDVIKSYEGLRSQGESLGASSDFLAAASESFRAAQARFRAGVADIVELLTAQKELANAKQEHLQALVDWRVASWKVSSSLGQLNIGMLEAMQEAEPAGQTVQPRIYAKSNGP